jgi:hypothetical protein
MDLVEHPEDERWRDWWRVTLRRGSLNCGQRQHTGSSQPCSRRRVRPSGLTSAYLSAALVIRSACRESGCLVRSTQLLSISIPSIDRIWVRATRMAMSISARCQNKIMPRILATLLCEIVVCGQVIASCAVLLDTGRYLVRIRGNGCSSP